MTTNGGSSRFERRWLVYCNARSGSERTAYLGSTFHAGRNSSTHARRVNKGRQLRIGFNTKTVHVFVRVERTPIPKNHPPWRSLGFDFIGLFGHQQRLIGEILLFLIARRGIEAPAAHQIFPFQSRGVCRSRNFRLSGANMGAIIRAY